MDQKCIGGPSRLCGSGFAGPYCTDCATAHYRAQRVLCVPCQDGQQAQQYMILILWVLGFNAILIWWQVDLCNAAIDTFVALKLFRAIGLMGSSVLPPSLLNFYHELGLFTMDFEFTSPGCDGSSSKFADIYFFNLMFLGAAVSPIVVGLPVAILVHTILERTTKAGLAVASTARMAAESAGSTRAGTAVVSAAGNILLYGKSMMSGVPDAAQITEHGQDLVTATCPEVDEEGLSMFGQMAGSSIQELKMVGKSFNQAADSFRELKTVKALTGKSYWQTRYIFTLLHWLCFATLILATLSMQALFCDRLDGEHWVLVADPNLRCGVGGAGVSPVQMWGE